MNVYLSIEDGPGNPSRETATSYPSLRPDKLAIYACIQKPPSPLSDPQRRCFVKSQVHIPLHSQSIIPSHLAHTLSKFKRKAATCHLKLGKPADECVLRVACCLYRKHAGFVTVNVMKHIGMAAIRSQSCQGGPFISE